jgi:4-alpha-glucanotransferase
MNRPQTAQGNWQWRLLPDQFDDRTVQELACVTGLFGRSG